MEKNEIVKNDRIKQAAEFYANQCVVSYSPYDFELRSVIGDSDGNIKAALNLRMSPQSALKLSESLQKSVQEYESKIGAITIPPTK